LFAATAPSEIYTLSLHDALPILPLAIAFEDSEEARCRRLQPAALARVRQQAAVGVLADAGADEDFCRSLVEANAASHVWATRQRSEEHTSELQSRGHLVCRLLLE